MNQSFYLPFKGYKGQGGWDTVLGRFPRGKGTLLDLEFLEDGMCIVQEWPLDHVLTRRQTRAEEWLRSVTYELLRGRIHCASI